MKEKRYKVYRASGSLSNSVPQIKIQGNWLTKYGFYIGVTYKMYIDENRIVIEKISNTTPD